MTPTNQNNNAEGPTFIIAEEMSVVHRSSTNLCSVKVRGNISASNPTQQKREQISCNLSFIDPKSHIDTISSKNYDCARRATTPDVNKYASFCLSIPERKDVDNNSTSWFGNPLIEYTCGKNLRPVPMLINTSVQELSNQCQIMFQLRVNPRNESSLLNAVVLVSVPHEYDGSNAIVNSVGRSIGKGSVDTTSWSNVTRILSWKLGELYSGAICEFEATFPLNTNDDGDADLSEMLGGSPSSPGETKFPVLIRYESEGCLLSGVSVDFGKDNAGPSYLVKRKFRVYHREV